MVLEQLGAKVVSYIAGALIVPLAVYSGYSWVQIKDLESALATSTTGHALCQASNEALDQAVESQNLAVSVMLEDAAEAERAAQQALDLAERKRSQLQTEIASLRAAQGASCEDAEILINEALGL